MNASNAQNDSSETPTQMGVSHSEAAAKSFGAFVDTIAALRRPDGCPWDREQTHASIASNMLEEAYEAVDTIEKNDVDHMREELGDVLLQVVLQSQIAADAGEFTIDDVCREVDAKIIRRHPHVFGEAKAGDANSVLDMWDQIKLAERAQAVNANSAAIGAPVDQGADGPEGTGVLEGAARPEGLLESVPVSFPALLQAQKISRKAVSAGFEWDTVDHVWAKVHEEAGELQAAYARAPKSDNGKMLKNTPEFHEAELEMGDVLFSLVNVARKMGIDAEGALRATCMKFRKRWSTMEETACEQGVQLEDLPMDEMQALWDQAKAAE